MPNESDSEAKRLHNIWYMEHYTPPERGPVHRAVSLAAWLEGWRQAAQSTATTRPHKVAALLYLLMEGSSVAPSEVQRLVKIVTTRVFVYTNQELQRIAGIAELELLKEAGDAR